MRPTDEAGDDLTRRQREVLAALHRIHQRLGYAPTLRELGDEVGLASASSVHAHLTSLERLGLVERSAGRPRALRAVPSPRQTAPVDPAGAEP